MDQTPSELSVSPDVLWSALRGSRSATQRMARAWNGQYDDAWSPVDVVVQNRRICLASGAQASLQTLSQIEATVAVTWSFALDVFRLSRPTEQEAALRALCLLSIRFPSRMVHDSLYAALLSAGDLVTAAPPDEKSAARKVLASALVPAWHQTLDSASKTLMWGALGKWELYAPRDFFIGWIWAWRFGIDRAADYIAALTERLGDSTSSWSCLDLADEEDLQFFANEVVAPCLTASTAKRSEPILEQMMKNLKDRTALADWRSWLNREVSKTALNDLVLKGTPTPVGEEEAGLGESPHKGESELQAA